MQITTEQPRIMLVDDEPAILAALKRALHGEGFEITGASSGQEALQLMQSHPVQVVISDQRMPVMQGTELLSRIEAGWPDTFRMILSGHADYDTVKSAIESGAVHKILAKPWNNTELIEQIHRAVSALHSASEVVTGYQSQPLPGYDSVVSEPDAFEGHSEPTQVWQSAQSLVPDTVQLQAILNAVADGIAVLDVEGSMTSLNSAMLHIFGYDATELLDTSLEQLIAEYSAAESRPQSFIQRVSKTNGQAHKLVGLRKNGEAFPMELTLTEMPLSETPYYLAVVRDTSRRVHAERQNQLLLKSLEGCHEGYALFGPGDRLVYSNQQFCRLYSACAVGPQQDVTYDGFYRDCLASGLFPEAQQAPESWLTTLLANHKNQTLEKVLEISPGRWIQIREERIDNGCLIAFHSDISELKQAEHSLQNAVERANDASVAKSRFLAMMSHEIRTPLNAVLGLLQLLQETELDARQKNYVDTALTSSQSLLTLISDILDFSKMEAGKMELQPIPCHLGRLVGELEQLLAPRAQEKSICFLTSVSQALPAYVQVDPQRLRQILLNLLSNAIKFTNAGRVTLAVYLAKDNVVFSVQDTGVGIPESQQSLVFSEFSSGLQHINHKQHADYNPQEGTGLGLAISQHLVHLMGGTLQFNSQQGVGSHFWCVLPLPAVEPPIRDTTGQHIASDDRRKCSPTGYESYTGHVLLVDDSATNRLVAKAMLESAGITVQCAEDGYHALEICKKSRFDLVLMDISMPGMDGVETTAQLLQLPDWGNIPVIALTAYVMPGDRERLLSQGMNDYIEKPLDKRHLLQVIGHYLHVQQNTSTSQEKASADQPIGLVNIERLQQLVQDTSAEMLPELVQIFIDDSGQRLVALKEAADFFANACKEDVERDLHSLGSSAALYGLMELSGQARRLERRCHEDNYLDVEAELPDFLQLAQQSHTALLAVVADWLPE